MTERLFDHVLVTGGAGYVGSMLVPDLLNDGYKVTVLDCMYYGFHHLPLANPNLTIVEGDLRDIGTVEKSLEGGVDAVIHLACISNDPSFDLDEALSRTINLDAFEPLVKTSKEAGVKRFIYASSSSVYGVSEDPNVVEENELKPLTLYSEFKAQCEPTLFEYADDEFTATVIRPATVCGYGPRCRLDLSVNILTNHAINKGEITVFGGSQKRPNLHIKDMVAAYQLFLKADSEKLQTRIFNVGFQNHSIMSIAEIVKQVVEEEYPEKAPINIKVTDTNDLRSYQINADRVARELGFVPSFTIEDAVRDLCQAFDKGKLPRSFDDDWYYNVRTMQAIKAE